MLSKSTSSERIREIFSEYGTVKEVYVMKDNSGSSKGCAFVKFESRDSAQKAINSMNEIYQDEGSARRLIVRWADNKHQRQQSGGRLLSKQVPFPGVQQRLGLSSPQLPSLGMGMQGSYGGVGPSPLSSPQLGYADYGPSGMGHLGHSPASAAYGNPYGPGGYGMPMSSQQMPVSVSKGAPGCNLFILNIPDGFEDGDLHGMFSNFGNVISANVFKDKVTGVSRGFGFVSYDNPSSAEKAIGALNGFMINGKRLKVSIKKGEGSSSSSSRPGGFAPY